MSKILFEKKHFFGGLLNLLAICLLAFAGSHLLFKEYILSVFLTLIIVFILLIFLNKKWFNSIIIDDERIIIEYPFNILGNKKKTISYRDGVISEVIYYGYMYRTPSHCKVISKERIFRFNCTLEEAKGLFDIFKANNINVSYNDEKEVDYR
ncbi:hypothetical protein QSE00_22990 [Arenibacter sp. M-2]|uniref:hypothetical protein n=1 Tax=Arenibacter sp. M-2 TaxID=3053612 RepID=UPI002570022B|nr:hypothetical protein [Arenibacter sp. M-2]MDL5514695.1 hypothetical protein [Arenibacter sp. M-2]